MPRARLSKRQRQILWLMNEYGVAAFQGGTRDFWASPALFGGIVINAYQTPEWFLSGRGLIERAERNVPGVWYRLTEEGRRLCPKREPQGLRQ